MNHLEKSMVPRRSLRIDFTPRELPFGLIGGSEVLLGLWSGMHPGLVLPTAFLVAVRVTIRLV
ncbi:MULTISPECIES: hypothetical protein [Streptomyces]|uniref:hypothetical protein n=1 Tax=Streptomyces TaxID=1883 RepID=UPI00123CA2E4|nr:hypothetical protein [Streptomyces galilaeus]QEU66721.1 hypothetical protein CP966_16700 [Streptomyces galilaeus]GGW55902.1 hypothetical protein GCM10010350_45340 [Streptomyces galilaeus]